MPTLFESFVEKFTSEKGDALRQLRKDILHAAPGAEEGISSGVPAFKYKGKYLASMNAAKNHLSLFVMRGDAIKSVKDDLSGFETTNVSVRFTPNKPIPADLVTKIISARMHEIDMKDVE